MSAVAGADQNMDAGTPFLEVNDLRMYFPVTEGIIIQRKVAEVKAVDGISFAMKKGETLGLVGESGCGKTTLLRLIAGFEHPTDGHILLHGDLDRTSEIIVGLLFQGRLRPCSRPCFFLFFIFIWI